MIQYDAYPGHTTSSTSYYVFEILSGTRITENLPMAITDGGFGPAYFVAGRNDQTGSHIAKFAVYHSSSEVPFRVGFEGVGAGASGNLTYITAPMNASNTVGNDVVEHHSNLIQADVNGAFSFKLPEYSVAVLEINADSAGDGCDYSDSTNRPGWKGWKHWRQHEHQGHWNN